MDMVRFANTAHTKGFRVIIAGAGGAAHLPGMVASLTPLPVIGVPVESKSLKGLDSLLSIVQMPGGVPVATMAINGGRNAGLFAVRILAAGDPKLLKKITAFQSQLAAESKAKNRKLQSATQNYRQG
jgi:5-(carboxyamino)imidazole ribonucleotide mutase